MAEQGIPKSLVFMKVTENEIYLAGVGMRFNDPYYRSLYTFIYDQGAALNALQMANHAQQEFYQITFNRFIPELSPYPLSHIGDIRYQESTGSEGEEKTLQWHIGLPPDDETRYLMSVEVRPINQNGIPLELNWSTLDFASRKLQVFHQGGELPMQQVQPLHFESVPDLQVPASQSFFITVQLLLTKPLAEDQITGYQIWLAFSDGTVAMGAVGKDKSKM